MRDARVSPDLDELLEAWGRWQDLRAQDAPLDERAAAFDRYVGARSRHRSRCAQARSPQTETSL